MSIRELIADVGDRLTPTERRIAHEILQDPTLLAFGTVSDLAERVGTSRPSVVRFATKLGFSGYPDLQRQARETVSTQISTPAGRIRRPTGAFESVRSGIESAVGSALDELAHEQVVQLAAPLVRARAVWILSGETSRAGAHVLRSGLSMVRDGVHLVEAHDVGRDLSSAQAGDAAVVIDFARYRQTTVLAARALVDLGVELVAITDGPLSPFASLTKSWCGLRVPPVGPFDSSLPAVLAAELIVSEVVERLGAGVRERVDRLERLWIETETFASPGGENSGQK